MSDLYKRISSRLEADWYPYRTSEWFTHDDICRYFEWKEQETKHIVSQKLYNDTNQATPKLEKKNKAYRLIDTELEEIDWMNADLNSVYKLAMPYGIWDNTSFGFEDLVYIPPKGIVLVAGVSNEGKTAFVMNMLVLNMRKYKCIYFTNELTGIGLKRRFEGFKDWVDLADENGKPYFRSILRYENYQDVVDPDGVNIIDYLDVNSEGEYFKLTPYIKQIQKKLRNGIAIIALQKPPGRSDAYGGANLRGAASLYLSIDKGVCEVVKAKDWVKENPNGSKYKFRLEHYGCVFADIQGIYEGGNGQ